MEYDIYVIAFPHDSNIEEYLEEKIMNIPEPPEEPIYCALIEGLESDDIKKELEKCLEKGFGVEEEE